MNEHRRSPSVAFLLRCAVLFLVLLAPIPWLADSYTTLFSGAGNAIINMLSTEDDRFTLSLEPPTSIRVQGSWGLPLHVVDRRTGAAATPSLSIRTFSYLPIATFLALAIASIDLGRRRLISVLGIGTPLVAMMTIGLASLPIFAKFGQLGVLDEVATMVVETLYQALATPTMLYALPLLVWWALVSLTSRRFKSSDV